MSPKHQKHQTDQDPTEPNRTQRSLSPAWAHGPRSTAGVHQSLGSRPVSLCMSLLFAVYKMILGYLSRLSELSVVSHRIHHSQYSFEAMWGFSNVFRCPEHTPRIFVRLMKESSAITPPATFSAARRQRLQPSGPAADQEKAWPRTLEDFLKRRVFDVLKAGKRKVSKGWTRKNKPMLNPNSYAVTQAKTNGVYKLILLSTLERLGTSWNLTWNFGSFSKLHLEPRNLLAPLGTFIQNRYLELWNFPKPYLFLEPPSGTFTGNSLLEPGNPLEPLLGTLEPTGSFTWNPSLEPGNLLEAYLEALLGTSEPCGMIAPVPQGLVWLRPQSFQLLGKNMAV